MPNDYKTSVIIDSKRAIQDHLNLQKFSGVNVSHTGKDRVIFTITII